MNTALGITAALVLLWGVLFPMNPDLFLPETDEERDHRWSNPAP